MSGSTSSRRGRPLAVYAAVIAAWVGIRVLTWELPFDEPLLANPASAPDMTIRQVVPAQRPDAQKEPEEQAAETVSPSTVPLYPLWREIPAPLEPIDPRNLATVKPTSEDAVVFSDRQVAAGHQLLWLAAMSHLPMPKTVEAAQQGQHDPWYERGKQADRQTSSKRWSLDAWIFLREGSGSLASNSGARPSYGASQEGAVLRYNLAGNSGRDLSAYARFTKALAGARETDLAAGLVARPVKSLPLWLHGEMRVTRVNGSTDYRPAAFAVTQVQRALPAEFEMRAYAQGGYVGGDFATAFADGQLVADREVATFDLGKSVSGKLRLGAGIWGGAQKGAQRLDIGPSANVVVPVSEAPVRLSVDYRIRAAGDAEPRSGVAVTLSTGF